MTLVLEPGWAEALGRELAGKCRRVVDSAVPQAPLPAPAVTNEAKRKAKRPPASDETRRRMSESAKLRRARERGEM